MLIVKQSKINKSQINLIELSGEKTGILLQ